MRQHLAKLPLASAPLTVEREREQKEEHLSDVLYLPYYTSHGREREREQEEHLHLPWSRACAILHRMTNCQHVSLAIEKNKGNHFLSTFLV
jgi:hypothetical protein